MDTVSRTTTTTMMMMNKYYVAAIVLNGTVAMYSNESFLYTLNYRNGCWSP